MVPNRHSAKNKNKHKCSSGSFKKLWQWHVDDDSIAYPKFTKIIQVKNSYMSVFCTFTNS